MFQNAKGILKVKKAGKGKRKKNIRHSTEVVSFKWFIKLFNPISLP